jgi:hypothetical protein
MTMLFFIAGVLIGCAVTHKINGKNAFDELFAEDDK